MITSKEKRDLKTNSIPPMVASSIDEINDWFKLNVDKRKLVTINRLEDYHDLVCGYGIRTGTSIHMSLPQYKTLTKLIEHVCYQNILFLTRKELCDVLGVRDSNLNTTLKSVSEFVKRPDGIRRGEVKLFINPLIIYKHLGAYIHLSREQAILKWYGSKGGVEYV